MPNNIAAVNAEIEANQAELKERAEEAFKESTTLTDEEQARLTEMKQEVADNPVMVVTEKNDDGTSTSIPVDEFMGTVDEKIREIRDASGEFVAKKMNVGDIKKSAEEVREQAQEKMLQAFRQMSRKKEDQEKETSELTDEEIIAINDNAIAAIQNYLGVEKLDSDEIIKRFKRLSLRQIADILPKDFVQIYISDKEIETNNVFGRERLLSTIAYLTVTGPEMDYLNEYIDHQHKLMMLSQRMVECQVNLTEVLKSKETLLEMAKKARTIAPIDAESIWFKWIKGGPDKVHNEFAQKAVVCELTASAYDELLEEYKDDPECIAQIQEQIDESNMKADVYKNVTNLELLHSLWDTLTDRFMNSPKPITAKYLEREAVSAMDRIRRAKQNVPFPIYSEGNPMNSKPELLYRTYLNQYTTLLTGYNTTVITVREKSAEGELKGKDNIQPIHVDGVDDEKTLRCFSMFLLILFGRVMKNLTPNDQTKFQAIELDLYFQCYCKLATDLYLMNDVWSMMKEFIEHAVKTWPMPTGKR